MTLGGGGCRRGASLDAIKLGVDFVAGDQFVVGAFLGDEAAFEHDDLVRRRGWC